LSPLPGAREHRPMFIFQGGLSIDFGGGGPIVSVTANEHALRNVTPEEAIEREEREKRELRERRFLTEQATNTSEVGEPNEVRLS